MVMSVSASAQLSQPPFVIENQPLKRYTRKEYDELVELGAFQGQRIELIYGQLVAMSPINQPHENSVNAVWRVLFKLLERHADVLVSTFAADGESVPEPDLLVAEFVDGPRESRPERALLLVEVSESSLRYDRGEKAHLYARSDVLEYWVVDTIHRTIEVRRDGRDGKWNEVRVCARGESIAIAAFPDIVVTVESIVGAGVYK